MHIFISIVLFLVFLAGGYGIYRLFKSDNTPGTGTPGTGGGGNVHPK